MRTAMTRQRPLGPADGADSGVERIFRTHRLGMVRLALLLVDDRETAEDVAQDAFAALHRRWSSLATEDAVDHLTSPDNPAESAEQTDSTQHILKLLETLPANQQTSATSLSGPLPESERCSQIFEIFEKSRQKRPVCPPRQRRAA